MASLIIVGHLGINRTKTRIGISEYLGGAGYHCAWIAGQILNSRQITLISIAGKDFNLDVLNKLNISTALVVKSKLKADRFLIEEESDLRRSFKMVGKLGERISLKNIEEKIFQNCQFIHLATASPRQQSCWLDQIEKKTDKNKKPIIAIDSLEAFIEESPEKVAKVFSRANLVFANKREWKMVVPYIHKINFDLILKKGKKGATFFKKGKKMFSVPSLKVNKIVDTTGAGEIVAGAFLAFRICGHGNRESLTKACRLASLTVEDFGIEHINKNVNFSELVDIINTKNENSKGFSTTRRT